MAQIAPAQLAHPLGPVFVGVADEEAAVRCFTSKRWRAGKFCPYCRHTKVYQHHTRLGRYTCAACSYTFSIKTGTIFHNSRRPMREWLAVIWLATKTETGLTIKDVADDLQIPSTKAWTMLTNPAPRRPDSIFLGCKLHPGETQAFKGANLPERRRPSL